MLTFILQNKNIKALLNLITFKYKLFSGPRELQQSTYLYSFQNELAINLATHLNLQLANDNRNISESTIQHYLDKHEKYLLEAVGAGYGEGGGGRIWIYPGCILFAISLLTTLGKTYAFILMKIETYLFL